MTDETGRLIEVASEWARHAATPFVGREQTTERVAGLRAALCLAFRLGRHVFDFPANLRVIYRWGSAGPHLDSVIVDGDIPSGNDVVVVEV